MSRRDAAIKKYQQLLPDALARRYGGFPPCTPGQVERTVSELGLNENYVEYACLLFCDAADLEPSRFTEEKVAHMREVMDFAPEKGVKLGPIAGLFSVVAGGVFDPCGGGDGGGE